MVAIAAILGGLVVGYVGLYAVFFWRERRARTLPQVEYRWRVTEFGAVQEPIIHAGTRWE